MKKILALSCIAAVLALSLAACGGEDSSPASVNDPGTSQAA